MKKSNFIKLAHLPVAFFALIFSQVANAAWGQKFASKLNSFNDELVIAAAVAFVTGVICLAITMMGGGSERIKRWGVGLVIAGILCFIAPDLGSFFFS
ncbi:TrbC/VirB2 family protein (plasmid) [Acinetobacter lwoffii]|jgi:hypothetical protein|uniref:Conjugal transfer protein TrbC n=2 Tax=Acinetobacter TaxID=469 RepID=N9HE95_ACILW|nr:MULTISPECIES: TrbC/VirB2 family protein [Acinetobacter]EET83872.1 hypothetical protein ACIRA0001_0431 [Acinetobacter radioresistens SK82]EJO33870.1 conjugal transfer protein TrbC [Acinetobacter radioresistens WC-A-157]ELA8727658.1 TrbC/VirB2 family protein [Acinetobacter baumannii]ENW27554.1 hypothetical protein F923_03113 [Acinetobacter lwoffii NIPH 478]ENX04157.1 hypothetical protein F899_00040 [Acinetobacter sp. CIP 101934]